KRRPDIAAAKRLDLADPSQPTIALVIGTDRRKGFQAELTGRSDTLILVRADPVNKSLSMLSFPRDLMTTVKCPGHPDVQERINYAFSECGAAGSVETVRALTGLPINYFVTVNFRGFMDLVNNLGGVWVDIDHRYHCDPSNISQAVREFVNPDVKAPEKARDVAFGIKHRTKALRPQQVSTTVLNGNGVSGSAANAAYELGQSGYKILTPPSGQPQNAPRFNYFRTTVYYDATQPRAKSAATQIGNLFGDADLKPLPPTMTTLANGAMATVVVGQNFHGSIAPAPVDQTPTK